MNLALLSLLRPRVDADDVAVARAMELAEAGKPVKFRIVGKTVEGRLVPMSIEAVEAP